MTMTLPRCLLATLALATGPLVAGCGGDDAATTTTTTTTVTATSPGVVSIGKLQITGVWARTSPSMSTAGAAYLKITNSGDTDDALVAVKVAPSVAAKVELHETTMASDTGSMMSTTTGGGAPMMRMSPVDRITIAADKAVSLAPGGYHIMLLDLAAPLAMGTTVELTLTFEHAGEVRVPAEVRDTAP